MTCEQTEGVGGVRVCGCAGVRVCFGVQCVYVLTAGNHLDTQQDKFSHPPEDRDRFDTPQVSAKREPIYRDRC
eukprot:8815696-Pyramimonas_sp.AAC.1